jgi:hypothetical protein
MQVSFMNEAPGHNPTNKKDRKIFCILTKKSVSIKISQKNGETLQLAAPKKCMQNFFLFYRKTCLTV